MSLVTDWIGVGGAAAVALGSGIQAVQAFDQLNDQTPLKNVGLGLIVAALRSFFTVVVPATNVETMAPTLKRLGLGTDAMEQLTDQQLVAEPGLGEESEDLAGLVPGLVLHQYRSPSGTGRDCMDARDRLVTGTP
jgi:hypothetical protein